MDIQQLPDSSLHDRVTDFLHRFKSDDSTAINANSNSESSLEEYLLARTAQELRAAQVSEETLPSD